MVPLVALAQCAMPLPDGDPASDETQKEEGLARKPGRCCFNLALLALLTLVF